MAFADPQTITINAIANTLARTGMAADSGNFSKDDANVKLNIKHSFSGSRARRLARVDHRKVAADPLATGYNKEYSMACYLVIDVPAVGYTNAEAKQVIDGFATWLTASTGANITKLLGSES